MPLMVRVAVAGKTCTEAGLMLQLPAPNVVGQVKVTVPLKPSCEAIEIEPVVPVLPALICGNALGSLKTKSAIAVTTRLKDVVSADNAPLVVACSFTGYVAAGVPAGTATLAVMFAGAPAFGLTVAPGVRLQVAPGIDVVQVTVT